MGAACKLFVLSPRVEVDLNVHKPHLNKMSGHYGKLGHCAPSSSGQTQRPSGNLFLEILLSKKVCRDTVF